MEPAAEARRKAPSYSEAIWDLHFGSLRDDDVSLLGIISYLGPDNIPQRLFNLEPDIDLPDNLQFCRDENRFLEAIKRLASVALIKITPDTQEFATSKMAQSHFKRSLRQEQRQDSFHAASELLYYAFPKLPGSGQFYEKWGLCIRYSGHVLHLKDCFKEETRVNKNFQASWKFCQLLVECQRFLYEICELGELEDLCSVNLKALEALGDEGEKVDLTASILSHKANLYESIGNPEGAIELNKAAYEMRLLEVPLKTNLVSFFENNIGYNYNTANDHKTALDWFYKSRDRWSKLMMDQGKKEDYPVFIKKNVARCLLYLNDLSGARELINASITEFKNENPVNWAMLAYAYFVLGTLERRQGHTEAAEACFIEAQSSWLKGDRVGRHAFNAACIYKRGVCCLELGKVEDAIEHLRDSIKITSLNEDVMPIEHARSLFKLSEALLRANPDSNSEAQGLKEQAEAYLKARTSNASQTDREESYDDLISIFWR